MTSTTDMLVKAVGGWELRGPRRGTAGGGSRSCLVASDHKGPPDRVGAYFTEVCLKVKLLEAVSSPSPSSRERHPHKVTHCLFWLMSDRDGVIHSLFTVCVGCRRSLHTSLRRAALLLVCAGQPEQTF